MIFTTTEGFAFFEKQLIAGKTYWLHEMEPASGFAYAEDVKFTVSQDGSVDVVLMDPPRSGSDEASLQSVCRLKPKKVVYISCNPQTQKRDLKVLCAGGYQVKEIQPVDMFPQTAHCENICLLER